MNRKEINIPAVLFMIVIISCLFINTLYFTYFFPLILVMIIRKIRKQQMIKIGPADIIVFSLCAVEIVELFVTGYLPNTVKASGVIFCGAALWFVMRFHMKDQATIRAFVSIVSLLAGVLAFVTLIGYYRHKSQFASVGMTDMTMVKQYFRPFGLALDGHELPPGHPSRHKPHDELDAVALRHIAHEAEPAHHLVVNARRIRERTVVLQKPLVVPAGRAYSGKRLEIAPQGEHAHHGDAMLREFADLLLKHVGPPLAPHVHAGVLAPVVAADEKFALREYAFLGRRLRAKGSQHHEGCRPNCNSFHCHVHSVFCRFDCRYDNTKPIPRQGHHIFAGFVSRTSRIF